MYLMEYLRYGRLDLNALKILSIQYCIFDIWSDLANNGEVIDLQKIAVSMQIFIREY